MKLKLSPFLVSIGLAITPLIFSSFMTYLVVKNEGFLGELDLVNWIYISLVFSVLASIAITPPTYLAMIYGYFLGWTALPYLFALNMISIVLVNFITKKLNPDSLNKMVNDRPKALRLLNKLKQDELKIIFFAKLSPVLPFALTNFVFTLAESKIKNILIGGFLGMIPRTLMAVWAGIQAKEIKMLLENPNEGNVTNQILILALVVVSSFGMIRLISKNVN